MKLSISNIAWGKEEDSIIYKNMLNLGYQGLEIAPSRILEKNPYDNVTNAIKWNREIEPYFKISSIQSIWYGKNENIFGTNQEREELLEYTKKTIKFATALKCKNIVFGCPKNRNNVKNIPVEIVIPFFKEIGDYANKHNVVISIEPNPTIYGTNFLNNTKQTIDFINYINSEGIKLNLDIGAMIYNRETLDVIKDNSNLINHIHISEPYLELIKNRKIHFDLMKLMKQIEYDNYISIEMKKGNSSEKIISIMEYIKFIFQEERNYDEH